MKIRHFETTLTTKASVLDPELQRKSVNDLNIDGIVTSLYYYLWKSIRKFDTRKKIIFDFSVFEVHMPQTVIIQSSTVVNWFYTNRENRIVKRYITQDIIKKLKTKFCPKRKKEKSDRIVAQFIQMGKLEDNTKHSYNLETMFFTRKELSKSIFFLIF